MKEALSNASFSLSSRCNSGKSMVLNNSRKCSSVRLEDVGGEVQMRVKDSAHPDFPLDTTLLLTMLFVYCASRRGFLDKFF